MAKQGWPLTLLKLVNSFLTNPQVRIRLEDSITLSYNMACSMQQGSPLSPVLHMLYLAELVAQDETLRFGYADNLYLYRASKFLSQNFLFLVTEV